MAVIRDISSKEFTDWFNSRPPVIQDIILKCPPDRLYRMKSTKHRVTIYSYSENGTVTVIVSGEYNCIVFPRKVFGIDPADLEECDLPDKDEPLGAMLTDKKDILEFIKQRNPNDT